MTERLSDDLARMLATEPTGLSGRELARRVRRRRRDVFATLGNDPRFMRHGDGPATRWRLARIGREPVWGPTGTVTRQEDRESFMAPIEDHRSRLRPEWIPADASEWLARDLRWRSIESEPPHWPGEVVKFR